MPSNTLYGHQNRISELLGMRRDDQANRDRRSFSAAFDVQPNGRVTLQAGMKDTDDHRTESVDGLQRVKSRALNRDGVLVASDRISLNPGPAWPSTSRSAATGPATVARVALALPLAARFGMADHAGSMPVHARVAWGLLALVVMHIAAAI